MTDITGAHSPDRRVRRTRRAILEALTGLILEKGYDAVTVTDIIAAADIGRSTFYAHFTDKRDVFNDIISDLAVFLEASQSSVDRGLFSFSLPLFEHIVEQRPVITALFGPNGHSVALRLTSDALGTVIEQELREKSSGPIDDDQLSLVVDLVVGAISSLIGHWITSPRPFSPVELDAAFRAFAVPGVERLLADAVGSASER